MAKDQYRLERDIPIPKIKRARKNPQQATAVNRAANSVLLGIFKTSRDAAEHYMSEFDPDATKNRKDDPHRYTERKRDFRKRIDTQRKRT